MRPSHLHILVLFCLFGCDGESPVAPTPDPTPDAVLTPPGPSVDRPAFKVMTYNVQLLNFGAANAETRKPMIIQIIRSEAPDIVGLQELSSTHRSDIEAGLQDLYDFYDGRSPGNSEPILLRKDVFAAGRDGMVPLVTNECGSRLGVTYLEVQSLRGVNVVMFNTHSCFNNPEEHAVQLVDAVARVSLGAASIVMGDLNARHGTATMNFLLDGGELEGRVSPVQLFDTWALAGGSRESTRVGTGIDWILTSDGTGQALDVTDTAVVMNASGASDHIPITATLF